MVDRQVGAPLPTILACVIIASQNLALAQPHLQARSLYHSRQTDNGGTRVGPGYCADQTATIQHQIGFAADDQTNCSASGANMDRFKIGVEDQHGFVHNALLNFLRECIIKQHSLYQPGCQTL